MPRTVFYGEKNVTDQLPLGLAGEFEIAKGLNLVSEIRYGNNFNSSRKDDPATLMAGFQADAARSRLRRRGDPGS